MTATLRAIWVLMRLFWSTHHLRFLAALSLMLIEAVAFPLSAPALSALTNSVVAGNVSASECWGILVGVLSIATLTSGHFAHILYFELGERAALNLDQQLIGLSNSAPGLEHHERPEYADRISVLRQELGRISSSGIAALLTSISLGAAMAMTIVLLGRLSLWLLLLPVAAALPVITGARAESVAAAWRRSAASDTRMAKHFLDLATTGTSAKEVRTLGLQSYLQARYARAWENGTQKVWAGELRATVLRIGGQLLFAAAYMAGTFLVVYNAVDRQRSVGDVVLALILAGQVNQQVAVAVTLFRELQRISETLADLEWVRGLVSQLAISPGSAPVPRELKDGIRFRGVEFHYPGLHTPVLRNVNLHLPAGATVAIVGENGAGKSSLVKLICRFYEPTKGTIECEGRDIREYDLSDWRRHISAGFQDFSRFELLAGQTVGVGDLPHIEDVRALDDAVHRAGAADVIDRLSSGFGTPLGRSLPQGTEISGGQWQRLALSRAMMRTSPLLLVLDEPTSSLDADAEHLLFERYTENARRRAQHERAIALLVSHRFSSVRAADLIIVVADSQIVELGNHSSLVAAKGLYAELYGIQSDQYD